MVPDDSYTSLCVEIFASPDEPVWVWSDERIAQQIIQQLEQIGWLTAEDVHKYWLVRIRHAYPRYDLNYRDHLNQVHQFLRQWPRLHLVGRTGSFRYLNSDGVIEDVFRFLKQRFPQTAVPIQPITQQDGRWA
jgi:protoporphyrinogen oxidase